jgi:hypothetical protein
MKRALIFVVMTAMAAAAADELKGTQPSPVEVIHVATALDHLSVLEFGEAVTMAAAGSAAFQIERHEDKVFIKPLKTGASTDLFVWTASRRFAYELEAPGEVAHMDFAINNRVPEPRPTPTASPRREEIADMMFAQAFVEADRVESGGIKDIKNRVRLRIEHMFLSGNTLYIHYSLRNLTARPYRTVRPEVSEILAVRPSISLASLARTQLDQEMLRKLGVTGHRPVSLARAENQKLDLQPGQDSQGLIAIREQVAPATIFQLTFGSEDTHPVQATVVY